MMVIGVWVRDGGGEVGGEEGAADGEVNGNGVFAHGGGEDEVDFRLGGEGRVEVGGEGGVEVAFGGEVGGGTAAKLVVAAEAEGAASTGELVEAVEAEVVEGVADDEGFGSGDGAASGGAAEGGGGGDGGRRDAKAVADEEGELSVGEEGAVGDTVAEEERGGTTNGTGAYPSDSI